MNKTVKITPGTTEDLIRFKTDYGLSYIKSIAYCTRFFADKKLNPADFEALEFPDYKEYAFGKLESLIKKADKRNVAFIRKQEQEILLPLKSETLVVSEELEEIKKLLHRLTSRA